MKYGKRRIVEECQVVRERSPGCRLAGGYVNQGTAVLLGCTHCKPVAEHPCIYRVDTACPTECERGNSICQAERGLKWHKYHGQPVNC